MLLLKKLAASVLFLFLFTACTASPEEGDLGDAATLNSDQLETLNNIFDGTADEKAERSADVAATQTQIAAANTQTYLLLGILVIAAMILVIVVVKNKKSK